MKYYDCALIHNDEELKECREKTKDLEKEIKARGPYVWSGYARAKKMQGVHAGGTMPDEWTLAEDIYILACAYAGKHRFC